MNHFVDRHHFARAIRNERATPVQFSCSKLELGIRLESLALEEYVDFQQSNLHV